jgi:predicted phage terminase large subunit-like protein
MNSLENSAERISGEFQLRTTVRTSLLAWARFALAPKGHLPAEHHRLMITALERLTHGETRRLLLLMPPGSAKSTYASLLFPAWWMACNPGGSVILASHTASLAAHFGRGVRALANEHRGRLQLEVRDDSRAAGRFATRQGGEFFAVGVNGAVTGRRADLALLDDPIASFLDAESPAGRDRLWNWFCSEFITRLKPQAGLVVTMTRWHRDDLAGRLLQQGTWTTLQLPALAELDDPMRRLPGAALWPDWECRDELLAKQLLLGDRSFAALFQQAPEAETGKLFDLRKLVLCDETPEGETVRAWDLAGTSDTSHDPDWTAGVKLVRTDSGGFVVDDVRRTRVGPGELAALLRGVAELDGVAVTVALPRDPGQAGVYQAQMLTRALSGFHVVSSPETGSKELRARGVASQFSSGNVALRRADWNEAFRGELASFPNGRKDDQVDALSRAFTFLISRAAPAHYSYLPHLGR